MSRRHAFLLLLGTSLSAPLALAHSPYWLPNEFDLSDRDHVSVQASFTEKFFLPDVAMKATNGNVVAPDGQSLPLGDARRRRLEVRARGRDSACSRAAARSSACCSTAPR